MNPTISGDCSGEFDSGRVRDYPTKTLRKPLFLKGYQMITKQLSGTEIVSKLRQADVLIAQDKTVPEVCREIGVSQRHACRTLKQSRNIQRYEWTLLVPDADAVEAFQKQIERWPRYGYRRMNCARTAG